MSFRVQNNIFLNCLLYIIAFGILIGSGSLYRYAFSYNLIMFFTILIMFSVVFYQFFIPIDENQIIQNNFHIRLPGLILVTFFIFFPILSDVINQVQSYEITYFHIVILFLTFLLGVQSRNKILKYYLNLIVIFSAISLVYFFIELFSEIPSFLPYYGVALPKLSHFYYVWSKPVKSLLIIRNSSIFWEPGAFGFHLIIATLLAYKEKNKLFIYILIAACISTLSTTVFIFLSLLLLYHLFFGVNKIRFIVIICIGFAMVLTGIKILFGNFDIPIYLMEVVTEKFSSSSGAYASYQERTLYTMESLKMFFDNFFLGAGHYATATELTEIGSETSALAGLLAELGLFGIFCIFLYMLFFKHFRIFAVPIALVWLNGEFMSYTPIALFILTHMAIKFGDKLFPVTEFKRHTPDLIKIKHTQ